MPTCECDYYTAQTKSLALSRRPDPVQMPTSLLRSHRWQTMTGWIIAAIIYVLGTVIVFRLSNDPMHRLMSPIWPVTLIFLLLTIRK